MHANASRSGPLARGSLRHQAQWNEADKQALAEIYRPGLGPVPGNHGPMETRSRRTAEGYLPTDSSSSLDILLLLFSFYRGVWRVVDK